MKIQKHLSVIVAIFALSLGVTPLLHAQEYDKSLLKDYVLPDITRKSLDLEFGSAGTYNKYTTDGFDDQKERDISGDLSTVFNYKRITRPYIGKSLIQIGLSLANTKTETSSKFEEGHFAPNFRYEHQSRFYKEKYFLEFEGNISLRLKNTFGDDSSQDRNQNATISLPVMVGKGRIEDVTDMRQAMYVVNGLEKKQALRKRVANAKLIELAQIMSRVKNKRFLDYRLHLQDEITAIDSFFVCNGYIEASDAKYFTTLYDYWLYGDRFERLSGMEFKAGVIPLFSGSWLRNEGLDNDNTRLGAGVRFSFDYEEPLNLYWQQSANASLQGNYFTNNDRTQFNNNSKYNRDAKVTEFMAKAGYSIGYYPNSRTHLKMGITELFNFHKYNYEELDDNNYNRVITTALNLETYYYISPQVRLSATADLLYNKWNNSYFGQSQSSKRWNANYNIGLTYSFF